MSRIDTSFRRGLAEVPSGKMREIRTKLMSALGIRDRHAYYAYRDGKTMLTVNKWVAVQAVFAQYGVHQPWGCDTN